MTLIKINFSLPQHIGKLWAVSKRGTHNYAFMFFCGVFCDIKMITKIVKIRS